MKTTLAVHAADWFRIQGWSVYFLDCGPERLGFSYATDVDAEFEFGHIKECDDVLKEGPPWIYEQLQNLSDKYDVVIADCPGGLNNFSAAALNRADVALIPTPPGYMDLQGTEWTTKAIRSVQNDREGEPQTGIIATRYIEGRRSFRTLKKKAKDMHFGFVESGVPELEIIRIARGEPNDDGTGWDSPPMLVWQMGRRKEVRKATQYFDALFHEVFAGADKADPMTIQRLVTPKKYWNDLESWHKKPEEEDDTRIAANS